MLRIIDSGKVFEVIVHGVPRWDTSLDERYELASLTKDKPTHNTFVKWWAEQCRLRHLPGPRSHAEDLAIAKRLTFKYDEKQLQRLAVVFFENFSDPLTDKQYAHHMRLFAHELPRCESVLERTHNG